jgi:hypothetical protein
MNADEVVRARMDGPVYRSWRARAGGILFTAVWLIYLISPVQDLFTGTTAWRCGGAG